MSLSETRRDTVLTSGGLHVQADELRQQLASSAEGLVSRLEDLNNRLAASQREVADLKAARVAPPAAKTSRWGRSR